MGKLFSRVQQSVSGIPGTGDATMGSAVSGGFQTLAAAGAVTGDLVDGYFIDGTAWEARRDIPYSSTGPTLPRAAGTFAGSSTGSVLSLTSSAVFISNPVPASLMTPDLFGTPGVPQSGLVRLGESPLAGFDWPSFRSAQTPERFVNPLLSRTQWYAGIAQSSGTTLQYLGCGPFYSHLNGTGIGVGSSANYATRQMVQGFQTTATAGTVGGFYPNNINRPVWVGGSGAGGFAFTTRFRLVASVTGQRWFVGLTSATAAPTNVNPSTLTNVIGIGQVDGSTNINLVFGGSAAQTPIDLGANFPANTNNADFYELWITSDPNDNTRINYQVNRWSGASATISNTVSGSITNTTPGTTLPATTTGLMPTAWLTNNATAANAQFGVANFYVWSD